MKQIQVNGSLWLETPEGLKIGKGRAMLLQKIDETGSIAEAARLLEMSCRRAWAMVKDMNMEAALPLVAKQNGGKNGGGAQLTATGKTMLGCYQQVFGQFQEFQQQVGKELSQACR